MLINRTVNIFLPLSLLLSLSPVKIVLPIVCFLVIVIFVALGALAHFRYPHLGHEKRHRNPQK